MTAATLLAWNHPATGYELGIFAATPTFSWVLIGLAMACGMSIIVRQAILLKDPDSSWLWGLLLLIVSRLTILFLPFIRGYVTWHGDNVSHLGFLKEILQTGHYAADNSYPITHTFLAEIIQTTGLSVELVANLSTAFFSVFFILSTYLLATALLSERTHQLIATTLAGMVFIGGGYNVLLMPNGWSIFLLPLLFYLFFKRLFHPIYSVPFLLLSVLYPFFHPLSALIIIISMLVMTLAFQFLWKNQSRGLTNSSHPRSAALKPMLIELMILLPWILSFNSFEPNIRLIWIQITSGGPDVLGFMSDTLSKINVHGVDAVMLFFKLYGVEAILIIVSSVGLVITWLRVRRSTNEVIGRLFLGLGALFLALGFMYLLYLLGMPGMSSIGGQRLLSYAGILTPILAAVTLATAIQRIRFKPLTTMIIAILLVVPAGLSLMYIYPSPYVIQRNLQVTRSELNGINWLMNLKGTHIALISSSTNELLRFTGFTAAPRPMGANVSLPDHFSYETLDHFGQAFSKPGYLPLSIAEKQTYLTIWQVVGRFTASDYATLEDDQTVSKVYDNGEYQVYLVVPYS
ncbi:hypothetical protein [Dehalogenimonas formicexedens]|uniref:hypothetical protein n=1 Tax=Dehalogenimonas formicexedens TaxID=1839801 RepID=UPI0011AB378F|nr:hypothetical protein [Dehalogenimonas formicexedens]